MLYLLAAVFAFGIFLYNSGDYHDWGALAAGPYLAAAIACEIVLVLVRRSGRLTLVNTTRVVVTLAVVCLAVLAPLGAELVWRAGGGSSATTPAHAQPEVAVIERAGDRAAAGDDPYPARPDETGTGPTNYSRAVDDSAFFPYFPGMVPFGMINALDGPKELTDARVALTGFTLIVGALAVFLYDGPRRRSGRAFQVLIAFPTGAMPLVTGGDDLPVIALMLLALVLARRRQPVWSGIAIGLAGAIKFTAWPLLLLLGLAQRDRKGRPAAIRYGLSVLAIVIPVMLVGLLPDPSSFVLNAVKFPLGLAQVKSPAGSPLLGESLVALFPALKAVIVVVLAIAGGAVFGGFLLRRPPRTPASSARFTGWALLVATILAPATRFGYFIYPMNLLLWGWLLEASIRPAGGEQAQPPSSTWRRSISRRLVGAV